MAITRRAGLARILFVRKRAHAGSLGALAHLNLVGAWKSVFQMVPAALRCVRDSLPAHYEDVSGLEPSQSEEQERRADKMRGRQGREREERKKKKAGGRRSVRSHSFGAVTWPPFLLVNT